ncbi:MAG: hypothetical protein ACF8NJ_00840 [Phycisphaerales bacterium JB038]
MSATVTANIGTDIFGKVNSSINVHGVEAKDVTGSWLERTNTGIVRIGRTVTLFSPTHHPERLINALRDAADEIEMAVRDNILTKLAAEHGDEILEAANGIDFLTANELLEQLEEADRQSQARAEDLREAV